MFKGRYISQAGYKLMLFAAAVVWGAAFVIMKDATDVLTPAQLVGVRFLLSGIVLAAVFHRRVRGLLCPGGLAAGAVMGVILFTAFWLQTAGLVDTTPGKNAFLTATYCVMVPFLTWAIYRRAPGAARIAAAVVCVAGIGLVSLDPGTFRIGLGDGLTLASAVVFAFEIIAISHFTKTYDAIGITVLQFLTTGAIGCIAGFGFEPWPTPAQLAGSDLAIQLVYLVFFSSCLCYVFQNVGLAHVNSSQGALILSLESVFGVIASVIMYGEVLTIQMVAGFTLIFAAISISELAPVRKPCGRAADDCELETGEAPG